MSIFSDPGKIAGVRVLSLEMYASPFQIASEHAVTLIKK
jgi:hypothetical protein